VKRNRSLRCAFEGDLAGALEWEAKRRSMTVEELAEQLLRNTCSELIGAWRETVREADADAKKRSKTAPRPSVESVLKLSYGPGLDPRPVRRRRASDSTL